MIIHIRGTSGSGKTTTAYGLMNRLGVAATDRDHEGKIIAYRLGTDLADGEKQVALIGRYETACGGCDTIKTQDEIAARVRRYHGLGFHVVFEGILASQIHQRYHDLACEFGGAYTFAYLDTPLEECLRRVEARRQDAYEAKVARAVNANNVTRPKEPPPLNPANTVQKWHDCRKNRERNQAAGHRVVDLAHADDPTRQVLELLGLAHVDRRPVAQVLPFPGKAQEA